MKNKKSVGIWLRVSTDFQVKDDSPEHHERRARLYAEAKDWNVVEVYRLDALSGKSVIEYPQTKKMLQDIKSGRITGLIFSKLARVARNTKELLDFADFFREQNADLISLQESIDTSTPAGRLFYTMIAAMAQWEREEIADRVAASVPIRAKMGKSLGGQASLGYKWEGKNFIVDESESPIRKLIYELFLKYKRKKTVATELNKMGYRTRNNSKFSDTTIHRLLRDSTAKGERRANYTKSLGDKKKWIVKPTSDWIVMPCAPIVAEDLWNECNRILDEQEKRRNKPGPRPVHLLSGFVHCDCGRKMYVFSDANYYKCKFDKNRIAVADLDEIYHDQLKSFLLSDSDIGNYLKNSNTMIQEKEELLNHLSKERETLRKKTDELVQMRTNNEMTPESFQRFYKPQEERLGQIENQLPELQAEVDFLKVQLLSSDIIIKDANDLYSSWSTLAFEQKRTIVETITEKITIGKEDINISLSYLPTISPNPVNSQRNFIHALPFSKVEKSLKKPFPSNYPKNPTTIGEHLLKKRIELKLLQSDVAKLLKVSIDTITNWENARTIPAINHYPLIIDFLGYAPFDFEVETIAGRIKLYRLIHGMSQKQFASLIGIDQATVSDLEDNNTKPKMKTVALLRSYIDVSI